MRGSPVVRFVCLAIALAVVGVGLWRLTAGDGAARAAGPPRVAARQEPAARVLEVPFFLTLSAPAVAVELAGVSEWRAGGSEAPFTGTVTVDAAAPQVFLKVRWSAPPAAGAAHFAKLVLEPPGRPTVTRVFDAPGDLDDFLELPFPTAE